MQKSLHIIAGILFLAGLAVLQGCTSHQNIKITDKPEITGVAIPVIMQPDSTVLVLGDYFLHPKSIDSVFTDKSISWRISPDTSELTLTPEGKTGTVPRVSVMKVWIDGFCYSLLLEKSRKIWQHISFNPKDKKYKKVEIAGEMNEWTIGRTPLHLKDGIWQTDLLLFPGKYQYKLVVDKKWILDPGNPESVDNNIGGVNSVLRVGNINPPGAPGLFTTKAEKDKITIGIKNKTKEIFVFWQNYQLDEKFCKIDSTGLKITIPGNAGSIERSFLRVWAFNASGTSNEILVPLEAGRVITDPSKLTRADKQAMIIYFLMVDRFRNGDPKNDAPLKDKEIDNKLNFQGGDLTGIVQTLEKGYFQDLGVSTLWISPITQNPKDGWKEYPAPHRKFSGYHGYWPITLTTIDPRFGTPDDLKELVKQAHGSNMNVLLDYVSNHVHQDSKIFKDHPDWVTPLILPNKKKNIRLWDEQRLTTWFDEFLPTLDLTKPEVCGMMSDSALFWVKNYELDGFRHDATKHIPEIYWRTLTKKLKNQVVIPDNRSIYQIGETFGSRDLIRSYVNPGELDAQFDFGLYFDARTVFARENASFKDLNYSLQESFSYYGEHSLMGNITGNQDLARFISFASGALSFSENDQKAGWDRDIEVKDTAGYGRLAMLQAFNMTIPGIPVIYYGDEFGMPGAGDPDNRRMMRFDNLTPQEKKVKETVSKLAHLRSSSMPLLFGDFKSLETSDKTYVYMRTYFDKVVFVIFNKDKSSRKIDVEIPDRFIGARLINQFGSDAKLEKNKITVNLKANSFEILTN
ncbi:MAG: alpha-amylase family glycosyl hydrolase [Bacteroidetes bacterium]|nr:alpha-amylase family glycosyl hydrolase [Bacteroidota bacterium]